MKTLLSPTRVARIQPADLRANTLRIVVFGPGRGEGVVVVLPDESVGVVDGCREPRDLDPVYRFVQEMAARAPGGATAFRLRFVCLTHPHSDHYGGTGRLISEYAGRIDHLWCTAAMQSNDAELLLEWSAKTRAGKTPLPDDEVSGGLERAINAYGAVLGAIKRDEANIPRFRYLGTGTELMRFVVGEPGRVCSWGPSDVDLQGAFSELVAEVNRLKDGKQPKGSFDSNSASGAILIRWGRAGVLLAGDLLRGSNHQSGWHPAVELCDGPVQVVNVAHHASEGAHHDDLWARMQPQLAIVTPFQNATNSNPPQPSDVTRLARSCVVAITSPPAWQVGTTGAVRDPAGVLKLSRAPGAADIDNAVGVSLDATGQITQLLLAGAANLYA